MCRSCTTNRMVSRTIATKCLIVTIIFSSVICHVVDSSQDSERTADVMATVQHHFQSGCLYILHFEEKGNIGLKSGQLLMLLGKLLSSRRSSATTLSYPALTSIKPEDLWCRKNRPIYAMLSSDVKTKTFLKQLKGIPMRPVIWLLFMDDGVVMDDFFSDVYVPLDCEFLVAQEVEERTLLTEVYRVDEAMSLQKQVFGAWSPQLGLEHIKDTFYTRRNDFQGLVMRGITRETEVYTTLKREGNRTILHSGYFGSLWNDFQDGLNFRTDFVEYTTEGDPNARYYKMIDLIDKENLDVAVDSFPMFQSTFGKVDYTTPSHTARIRILVKPRGVNDMGLSSYVGPFSARLWYTICLAIVVLAACLAGFNQLGRHYASTEGFDTTQSYSLSRSLFYVFGIFCQQGHDVTPRSCSCRVVYWVSYLTALVLLAAYSGTLISFLANHRNEFPFFDLKGLLAQNTYLMGTLRHHLHYFTSNKSNLLYEVYMKRFDKRGGVVADYVAGIRRVCDRNFALWGSLDLAQRYMDRAACSVLPVPNYGYEYSVAMALANNSPYRIFLDHRLAKMRDTGVMMREHQTAWYKRSPLEKNTWSSVSLRQVTPLLVILGAGITLAIVMLLLEMVTMRFLKTRRNATTIITWTGKQQIIRPLILSHNSTTEYF
ncbi:probable glutamate receptor [Periplaneta americana]|uniref:probable glutamate receptor n=1 Tax=Periplaneta americana TaxID=6978 RepID=UPI0037E7909C